mgnify:CR=1 FL=1
MSKRISVIIPVFNDPKGLKETVDSLLNQKYSPNDYEIIIVDNCSTDDTPDVVSAYLDKYPGTIRSTVEKSIKRSYMARNRGLELATSSLICFIDSNVVVQKDFFFRVIKSFDNDAVDYLGVNVVISIHKDTLTARYNKMNGFQISSDIKYNHYSPTCCLIVNKTVFNKVGKFYENLESGGDWDFGQRVFNAGFNQRYNNNIIVYHPARWKYSSLIIKAMRVSRGIAQLSHYFPSQYSQLYNSQFNIRRFLPGNPIKLYNLYNLMFSNVHLYQIFLLSIFHLPIRIISFFSLINEKIKLSNIT